MDISQNQRGADGEDGKSYRRDTRIRSGNDTADTDANQ